MSKQKNDAVRELLEDAVRLLSSHQALLMTSIKQGIQYHKILEEMAEIGGLDMEASGLNELKGSIDDVETIVAEAGEEVQRISRQSLSLLKRLH